MDHIQYLLEGANRMALFNPHTERFAISRWQPDHNCWLPVGEAATIPGLGDTTWPDYSDLLTIQGSDYPTDGLLFWWPDDTGHVDLWRIYLPSDDDPYHWSNPVVIITPDGSSIYPASVIAITQDQDGDRGRLEHAVAFGPRTEEIPFEVRKACRFIMASLG